jgi:hypothetical protein
MAIPTDDQLNELWDEIGCYYNLYPEVRDTIREAINRWGTLEPIALEDREPQQSDLDDYGFCWWWDEFDESWELLSGDKGAITSIREYNKRDDYPHHYTYWLPHWAIKHPKGVTIHYSDNLNQCNAGVVKNG